MPIGLMSWACAQMAPWIWDTVSALTSARRRRPSPAVSRQRMTARTSPVPPCMFPLSARGPNRPPGHREPTVRDRPYQPRLPGLGDDDIAVAVARAFEPSRLTQARLLADMTKAAVAKKVGLSAAAIGQFESGASRPRPEHLPKIAAALDVPVRFF